MAIIVTCTCGKQFKVKDELAGKRGKCAACGRILEVPTPTPTLEREKASPSPLRVCPACREALQPNAVICLGCGLDLRTGKQLPHAKSSGPAVPGRPTAKAPFSSARLRLALIAGGTCLAGVVVIVVVFLRGAGTGNPAVAPQPNSGIQKKTGSDSKNITNLAENPQALQKLLKKVTAITPDDVARYEKFLREPTFFNSLLWQGALNPSGDDIRELIKLGLEKPAVAALIKLAQEKKSSTDKADLLICSQSIKALGQFGSHAREATPLLAELQNYKDIAVGSAAKSALANINGKPQPPAKALPSPAAEWAAKTAKRLESRRLVTVNLLKRVAAKIPPDTLKQWRAALDEATGQKVDVKALYLQVLVRFGPLWKGEEFLPAESERYVGRIKQLPKDVVDKWHAGFEKATAIQGIKNAVLALIQMDYLYESERFRAVRAGQLLPRLQSLSPELLQPWAKVLGGNTLTAALELLNNDWLFENDRIKTSAAKEALQVLQAANAGLK